MAILFEHETGTYMAVKSPMFRGSVNRWGSNAAATYIPVRTNVT